MGPSPDWAHIFPHSPHLCRISILFFILIFSGLSISLCIWLNKMDTNEERIIYSIYFHVRALLTTMIVIKQLVIIKFLRYDVSKNVG